MNKLFKTLSLLAVIAFLAVARVPPLVDVAQAAPAGINYEATLGKSVNDKSVTDFIASNNCAAAGQFQLCQSAGLALWTDNSQIIKTAYLYVNPSNDVPAYKGELPLGLAASDTMASVEQRLGQPVEVHAPQAGWKPGLPDEGSSPDHMHYWAIYRRFGLTVIYNSPSADDKNATIYAILVSK
jgi:hypothetical protein